MPDGEGTFDPRNAYHQRRRLSFGATADAYHRFRPSYPREAVEWALGTRPLEVAEIGAGTGLMTEVLIGAGHTVHAVEPDPGMCRQLVQLGSDRLTVLQGGAEDIPLDAASVDAVASAQAFHWFDPARAVPEIARVLRPDGVVAIVWNVRNDDVAWVAALSQIVGRLDARSGTRDLGIPELGSHFSPAEHAVFSHEQPLTPDTLVALVDTFSYVATSPERESILDEVRDLARTHPELAGRDTFALPYDTLVYRATLAAHAAA